MPPLPNEHGAWAMLAIPLVLGFAASGCTGASALLLVPAMILLFLSRYAAVPAAARRVEGRPARSEDAPRLAWGTVYLGASLACLAAALSASPPGTLAAALSVAALVTLLGAAQTGLALTGRGRSMAAELLGMAGLASSAPLVMAASGRPLDARAAGAGLLPLLYSVSSLAFVRAFRGRVKRDAAAVRAGLAAHLGIALALAGVWGAGWIPAGALVAFVPVFVRTAWGALDPPRSIRILGRREVVVAVLFTGIAALALRP